LLAFLELLDDVLTGVLALPGIVHAIRCDLNQCVYEITGNRGIDRCKRHRARADNRTIYPRHQGGGIDHRGVIGI
jgi:hypothetical protein